MGLTTNENGRRLTVALCEFGAGSADPEGRCATHDTDLCVMTYYSQRHISDASIWDLLRWRRRSPWS